MQALCAFRMIAAGLGEFLQRSSELEWASKVHGDWAERQQMMASVLTPTQDHVAVGIAIAGGAQVWHMVRDGGPQTHDVHQMPCTARHYLAHSKYCAAVDCSSFLTVLDA